MYLEPVVKKLLPEGLDLRLDCFEHRENGLFLKLRHNRLSAPCPVCGRCSTRVHSRYTRCVTDLPWAGIPLKLLLVVRRFRCSAVNCPRRIFAERFPSLVDPYARLSSRLQGVLERVALSLGGEPGKRLLELLGVFVSGDKLLSLAYGAELPTAAPPQIIGVDDFALKRGRTYGTVIVNLETRQPIALLPDRTAETLAAWLELHPEVQIISRDRSTEYERGINLGAPHAKQVLDRWHLLKNLGDALERQLRRYQGTINELAKELNVDHVRVMRSQREEAARQAAQQKRLTRMQAIRDLHAQGMSMLAITHELRVSRTFVRHVTRMDVLPDARYRKSRPSTLDPFEPYLNQRWDEGCRNAMQLWREVKERGYPGCYKRVHQWRQKQWLLEDTKVSKTPTTLVTLPLRQVRQSFAPRQLAWLLMHPSERLSAEEKAVLNDLINRNPAIGTARNLAQGFRQLFGDKKPEQLEAWFEAVRESGLDDLRTFALSLARERDALTAAILLPWSNGPTEGVVTKLKLIKRSMYGRGSFDLLRKRVLLAG